MSIALLVDRSLPVPMPNYGWELCDLWGHLVTELHRQIGSDVTTVIAYSEVARTTTLVDAAQAGADFVYGSNLQHALLLARAASRETGSSRIVLVTYSLPSAHHISGQPFFTEPPIAESLEAARFEAQGCASDGIRIDTLLLVHSDDGERVETLQWFFSGITEQTGGNLVLVSPGDQVESVVEELLGMNRQ